MVHYILNFTIHSPCKSATFMEFSPAGRFLAVGDKNFSLHILDKLTGFHPIASSTTLGEPTALVWETSKAFYLGLNNGVFIHYQVDLGEKKLVKGVANSLFHGAFPVTALALDADSKTLVLSVGPGVFALRRIHGTGMSLLMNWGNKLTTLEVTSVLWPTSRTVSISKGIPESQLPRFQGRSVSPQATHSSSHFVVNTWCKMHYLITQLAPKLTRLFLAQSSLSSTGTCVYLPHSRQLKCEWTNFSYLMTY